MDTLARKLKRKKPQIPIVDRLDDDCLHLVFEIVYLRDGDQSQDLFNLSLVSRQFYKIAIPWMYRIVSLDFSKQMSLRLLDRLTRIGSKLPLYIRVLKITAAFDKNLSSLPIFAILCTKLVNLKRVEWSGISKVSRILLGTLENCPQATFAVFANTVHSLDTSGPQQDPRLDFLLRPAASQLTRLCLKPSDNKIFYPEFKKDLISMLTRNTALHSLIISPAGYERIVHPEMREQLRKQKLPNLRILKVHLELFSPMELMIWGKYTGWHSLQFLDTWPEHFLVLHKASPKASEMTNIMLQCFEEDEMDNLEREFGELQVDVPKCLFRNMRAFEYRNFWSRYSPQQTRHVFPWFLLERMPHLIFLDLSYFNPHLPQAFLNYLRPTPYATDIQRLQEACPNIKHLVLDMVILDKTWPADVLEELAKFKNPVTLALLVHVRKQADANAFYSFEECRNVYKGMVERRKELKLPFKIQNGDLSTAFFVIFKVIRPDEEPKAWGTPDWSFYVDKTRFGTHVQCYEMVKPSQPEEKKSAAKTKIEDLTYAALVEERNKEMGRMALASVPCAFGMKSMFNREKEKFAITNKEMQRRKGNERAEIKYGNSATLYDLWNGGRSEADKQRLGEFRGKVLKRAQLEEENEVEHMAHLDF